MKKAIPPDPVEQDENGKWWFWNEIWTDRHGPYDTKEQVAVALRDYCVNVLGYDESEIRSTVNEFA